MLSILTQKIGKKIEFGKEMNFVNEEVGRPRTRDKSFGKLLESSAIMALGVTTIFLSDVPDEICDRLKLFLQEKPAGNTSNSFNEEIIARIDRPLVYRCISKKQHTISQLKRSNYMKIMK